MWNMGLAVCLKSSGSVLTDGVSGPDRVGGDGERAESKSVLSSDPEQVFLTLQQTWNHVGLAGTSCVHLITDQWIISQSTE